MLQIRKEGNHIYGKHFESMYTGSMYGAGVAVFAVWGYVISHARKGTIELNPKMLADVLGGTVEQIEDAIKRLCQPDPDSRHKECEGRRMVQEGEYQYRLPSWDYYQGIRNEAERREYNRRKQAEYRRKRLEKAILGGAGTLAERNAVKHEVAAV